MSGLEETLTETISGLFEMISNNIIDNSGVGDFTMIQFQGIGGRIHISHQYLNLVKKDQYYQKQNNL